MKYIINSFLAILFIGLFSCEPSKPLDIKLSPQAKLIRQAKIINVQDGSILEGKAILIDSAKIKLIADDQELTELLPLENQVDASGKYIIPGLWDMHVHFEGQDLIEDNMALFPVFIAYGITTVRDMASDLGEQVLQWREDIEQNKFLAPQIFTAGRKLEGIDSFWKGDLEIANEEELKQMLDNLENYQVDLVKVTENALSGDLFLKSVQQAHDRGFLVSAHVPLDLSVEQLANAGLSSVEHASYFLRLGTDENKIAQKVADGTLTKGEANNYYAEHFDQDSAFMNYQKLGKLGLAITPTLISGKQLAYYDQDNHSNDEFLSYLTERFTSNYQWRIDRLKDYTPKQWEASKVRYQLIAKQLPYIQKAGMTILAGSDAAALNTFVYPAYALHQELMLFEEAGLSPLQALQAATINAAEFMGKSSSMGSVEKGKQADLVILNSNPLESISATQDIFAVINNGQYYDRMSLDTILEQAQKRKKELDQERK
ncbi:amidohydrolase family protein [Echinicola shivajiensis]|uniref:amidohydrolase family protein n=1 Tax=Echinicola shivajiensis TaxID=1035916 RepID=UPI001BFC4875|nr:amidohydrolase family protein [Echinicola shivajiensis]